MTSPSAAAGAQANKKNSDQLDTEVALMDVVRSVWNLETLHGWRGSNVRIIYFTSHFTLGVAERKRC